MIVEDHVQVPIEPIYAPAETLTCKICGREYVSRGKFDPGYCRDCEARMREASAPLVGGPLGQ